MTRALVALIICLVPFATLAEDRPTFESLWQAANSKPDHKTVDEGRTIRVEIPSEKTIYFFTKPGQPEHPGVFRRSVVQSGNGIYMQTKGWSFGNPPARVAFERILAQFQMQDAQLKQKASSKP
jgi:hypothetical protein